MCHGEHYRKAESFTWGISKAFLPEIMNEDQHYRRKYRNALIEINNIIQPFKDTMDIFKEISKIMERCDI
jgi:hypothetical protein